MDDTQAKLGAILNNPEMMQQIMAMAQSLGAGQPDPPPKQENTPPQNPLPFNESDLALMQRLSGFASSANVDKNQQLLLKALHPYLANGHLQKLEKAMRAAKLAQIATSFLGQTNPLKR